MSAVATVTCMQCNSVVAASAADFSADGMLCTSCSERADVAKRLLHVPADGRDPTHLAESIYERSLGVRHVALGAIGVVLGAAYTLWGLTRTDPIVSLYAIGAIVAGAGSLAWGIRKLRRFPKLR